MDIKTGKPKPPSKPKKVRVVREPTKSALELVRVDPRDPASAVRGLFIRSMWEGDEGHDVLDQVTDCDLVVDCVVDVDGERQFSVFVISAGEVAASGAPRRLNMDTLENERKLNAWASAAGCCWNLDDDLRWELKKYLHAQPGARRVVFTPTVAGYHTEFGVWVMQGTVIDARGVGVNHVPGERSGPVECADGVMREFIAPPQATPVVDFMAPGATWNEWSHARLHSHAALGEYLAAHHENYGHSAGALALGWMTAGLRRDAVLKRFLAFPILYVVAAAEEGKNTFVDMLMCVAGIPNGCIKVGTTTTIPGLRDDATGTCNLPMWVDELRNDDECRKYESWMRGMFDASRQVMKGSAPVPKRPLVASGQEVFGSRAEHLRYVLIRLEKRTINRAAYPKVKEKEAAANLAFTRMMASSVDEGWSNALCWCIERYKEMLYAAAAAADAVVSDRQVFCWAVPLAGLVMALHPDPMQFSSSFSTHGIFPQEVFDEACRRMLDGTEQALEESEAGRFWDLMEWLDSKGWLNNMKSSTWCKIVHRNKEDVLAVSLNHLLFEAAKYPQGRTMRRQMLRQEFASNKDYRGWGDARLGDRIKKCMFFTAATTSVPVWVLRLARHAQAQPETNNEED